MPQVINTQNFTVNAAGATFTVDDTDTFSEYVIGGAAALVANNSVIFGGTPLLNMNVRIRYEATCTNAGGTVTILGTVLNNVQMGRPCFADCNYNGASWDVQVYADASSTGWIVSTDFSPSSVNTAAIANNAVTHAKYQTIADQTFLGNVSGGTTNPSALTVAQMQTALGVNSGYATVYYASITIPTASVLTLNATPLTIVAAPGAGLAIQVVAGTASMTYNTTPYATNGVLSLISLGSVISQAGLTANGFLFGTVTRNVSFEIIKSATITDTQIGVNAPLLVQVDTGNPTAGDSDITVTVLYRILPI
jgi:hypothetical protein